MPNIPISVQLYTLRNLTETDFPAALKQVAAIGYRYVELAGFGNLKTPADAKKALDDAALKVSGVHVQLDRLTDPNQLADEADILNHQNIIVAWLKPELRNEAGYNHLAAQMNTAAPILKKRNKQLAYHNHDFEFQKINGRPAFDILWNNTDPTLIKSELDLFWALRGGVDPITYMQKLGPRLTLLHLKDQSKTDPTKFAEVGAGTMDFPAILKSAAQLPIQFAVVEQDDPYGQNPLNLIRTSLTNLKKMGLA
jgi:sugar phosphate isomerase/epimerase